MSMEYDRRPTRVYQREDHNIDTHDACAVEPTGGARPQSDVERDERIGYTQPIATAGSVFDGISIAQVRPPQRPPCSWHPRSASPAR